MNNDFIRETKEITITCETYTCKHCGIEFAFVDSNKEEIEKVLSEHDCKPKLSLVR